MKKVIVFLLMGFYLNTIAQCVPPDIPAISASSTTVCISQNATLSIASGSLNNATTWHWYSGSCAGTPVGTGTVIVINPNTNTSYFVRGEGGCVTPGSCASVSINVAQAPSVTTTFTNPSCFGQSNGQISLTAVGGPGPFTYNWSNMSTGPMLFGINAGAYTATITGGNGCKTYTTINIIQPNVLMLNVSPVQTICNNNIANVYASAIGGTAPYQYTITNLATNTSTNLTTTLGINAASTLTSTTTFTVKAIDAKGCYVGPSSIIVNVKPPLIAANSTVVACDRDSIIISPAITSPGNGGPYSYNWSNTSNNSSINVIASLINSPQNFTVSISDGCTISGTSAVITVSVSACVGFKENVNSDVNISFYPNPAKDILIMESDEVLQVKLFSVLGDEILSQEITNTKNKFDLSALNNGIYFLSFYNKNEKLRTEKIIVQH